MADFDPRTELKAPIPPITHLVTVDFVRAVRGISADAVQALVEAGQFRFTWNLNARPGRKQISELRFWIQEVLAPIPASVTLPDVIKLILGERRTCWRGAEVAQMLLVSRPCIHRLRKSRSLPGKVTGHTLFIQRPALEKFLIARLCGAL